MVYIKLSKKEDLNLKEKIKLMFCGFKKNIIEDTKSIVLEIFDLKEKTFSKLFKFIKENCISWVCLSKDLIENDDMVLFLCEQNVKIFDGKWLFKNLTPKTLEYVMKMKKESLVNQEISILTNSIDKTLVYIIENIAKSSKVVNIVTKNERLFKRLKDNLYNKYGIILNFYDNNKKALLKSSIILNYNFSNEEINYFLIPHNSVVINFEDKVKINQKSFLGINILDYELELSKIETFENECFECFNKNHLIESFLYKNTLPENIQKVIEDNEINIKKLYGKSGEIKKSEYLKNIKKMANLLDKSEN